MTKKNNNLINEGVVRRWGKLANMAPLTENFLDTVVQEEEVEVEDEEVVAELPMDDEVEVEMDAEVEVAEDPVLNMEEDDVAALASMLMDTLAVATNSDIVVTTDADAPAEDLGAEADALDDEADALGSEADAARDMADADRDLEDAEDDLEAAMRKDAYNRDDEALEEADRPAHENTRGQADADGGHRATKDKNKKKGEFGKGRLRRDPDGQIANRKDESLDVDLVDDEALTEAVLERVITRLLNKSK